MARKWEIAPNQPAWNFEECEETVFIAGYELVSPGFGPVSAQEASRNACILSVSCRSMTNFAKMLAVAEFRRNSGMLCRRALATTSSEGGMPGRMVRSQEPKACQTRCGKATARY